IHRDLKPDNVLVTEAGTRDLKPSNVLVDEHGQPKILDFGVARATDADVQMTVNTAADQIIGTVQYMSPEQAGGSAEALDIRSDIYSLGVMLFELLAGRLPYDVGQQSLHDSLLTIRTHEPDRLSRIDERYRGDISVIVGKCLEKDAARRYDSCSELAADIRRYLRHEPISARPPSRWYQVRKFARRNRALVVGLVATLVALCAGLVLALLFALQSQRSEARALYQAYRASITATVSLIDVEPEDARRCLDDAPMRFRGWEWSFLDAQLEWRGEVLEAPAILCSEAGATPDGGTVVAVARSGAVWAWSHISGGAQSAEWHRFKGPVTTTAIDDAAGRVAVQMEGGGGIRLWERGSGEEVALPALPGGEVERLCWDRAGRRLAAVEANRVHIWDGAETWRTLVIDEARTFKGVVDLAFVPNADELMVAVTSLYHADTGNAVRRVSLETGEVLAEYETAEVPSTIALSPDGTSVALGCRMRSVRVLRADDLSVLRECGGHRGWVRDIEYAPDGSTCASIGSDGIRVWDVRTGRNTRVLPEVAGLLRFTPDGSELLAASGTQVRCWNTSRGLSTVLSGHDTYVYEMAYSPDGSLLASTTFNTDDLHLWDPRDARQLGRIPADNRWNIRLCFPESTDRLLLSTHSSATPWQVVDPVTGVVTPHRETERTWAEAIFRQNNTGTKVVVHGGRSAFEPRLTSGIMRCEFGEVTRVFADGHEVPLEGGTPMPVDIGPVPHLVCIGGVQYDSECHEGSLSELLVFEGVLGEEQGREIEAYLRRDPEEHAATVPATPGHRLVLHLLAEAGSVVIDDAGRVRSWRDAADPSVVLRACGEGAGIAMTAVDGRGAVTFAGRPGRDVMTGLLPADVDLKSLTVLWRGQLDPEARGEFPVFSIGQAQEASPKFWSALPTSVGPLRVSNSEVRSADGGLCAVLHGHFSSPLCVLDGQTGAEIWRHEGGYRSVDFCPDGRLLAAGRTDGGIEIWDVARRRMVRRLEGHLGTVYSVAFSPDGTRLASGGNDTTIRIWDTRTGAELLQLRGHDQYVKVVRFSPDGTQLASGSGDRTVRIWDTVPVMARREAAAERARLREQVRPLVDRVSEQTTTLEDAAARLRTDPDLAEDERAAALDVLRDRRLNRD
ncbi:MAG: protein kinase, partial [Phycisphaerales bacterium]|nr:protein kinase [Phycisphaerales bacterium]